VFIWSDASVCGRFSRWWTLGDADFRHTLQGKLNGDFVRHNGGAEVTHTFLAPFLTKLSWNAGALRRRDPECNGAGTYFLKFWEGRLVALIKISF